METAENPMPGLRSRYEISAEAAREDLRRSGEAAEQIMSVLAPLTDSQRVRVLRTVAALFGVVRLP